MNKSRYEFIDIAKGIGIILVMMGHFFIYRSTVTQVIYSFHMPMFFFLSGIFISAPNADSLKDKAFWLYIWKKTKRLLAMYCLFLGIAVISTAVFEHKIYPVKRVLKALFGYRLQTFHMGPIWFLVALYFASIVVALLHLCRFYRLLKWEKYLLMGILAFIAYRFPVFMRRFDLPFMPLFVNTIPMVLLLVLLGTFCRQLIINVPTVPMVHRIIVLIISAGVTMILSLRYLDFIRMVKANYGRDLFLFLLAATTGTIAVLFASSLLADHLPGRVLAYVGRHTMFILGMHRIVSYYCTKIIYHIFKVQIEPAKSLTNGYAFLWTLFILLILLGMDWCFLKFLHLWKRVSADKSVHSKS